MLGQTPTPRAPNLLYAVLHPPIKDARVQPPAIPHSKQKAVCRGQDAVAGSIESLRLERAVHKQKWVKCGKRSNPVPPTRLRCATGCGRTAYRKAEAKLMLCLVSVRYRLGGGAVHQSVHHGVDSIPAGPPKHVWLPRGSQGDHVWGEQREYVRRGFVEYYPAAS
jgi:hypothetical protein